MRDMSLWQSLSDEIDELRDRLNRTVKLANRQCQVIDKLEARMVRLEAADRGAQQCPEPARPQYLH
jgi:hypothetical protein